MWRMMLVSALFVVVGCGAQDAGQAPQSAQTPAGSSAAPAQAEPAKAPEFREVTVPAGTQISLVLGTSVASDQSKVEDVVRARVANPVAVDGANVIPAEAQVRGTVADVQQSGRIKGRARLAIRFERLAIADEEYDINAAPIVREAEATKGEDAKKVGIGAGAGAAVGALVGGKKGALVGGAVGGGAGTGLVMATRGEEVRLPAGTRVTIRLRESLTVRVPR